MDIRERLRAAIVAKGMKHSWVANEAGITPATLSNILTGRTSEPSLSVILAICRAVGEPLAALLGEPAESLLESEQQVLREAIQILERRILRSRRTVSGVAASPDEPPADVVSLTRHEIPAAIYHRGARLAFRACGEEMAEEKIHDGDILYVRPVTDARAANGHIAICRIDGTLLVRKLITTGRGIRLQNGNTHTIVDPSEVDILGVVIAHLSEL